MLNFYLYSVTSISLTVFYIAAIVLANGLLQLWLGVDADETTRRAIAIGAGFATISLPVWGLHWHWLRLQFGRAQGPAVNWHRFYLFTIICFNAMAILIGGGLGVTGLVGAMLALGDSSAKGLANAGGAIFAFILSASLWWHHWRQFKGGSGELRST